MLLKRQYSLSLGKAKLYLGKAILSLEKAIPTNQGETGKAIPTKLSLISPLSLSLCLFWNQPWRHVIGGNFNLCHNALLGLYPYMRNTAKEQVEVMWFPLPGHPENPLQHLLIDLEDPLSHPLDVQCIPSSSIPSVTFYILPPSKPHWILGVHFHREIFIVVRRRTRSSGRNRDTTWIPKPIVWSPFAPQSHTTHPGGSSHQTSHRVKPMRSLGVKEWQYVINCLAGLPNFRYIFSIGKVPKIIYMLQLAPTQPSACRPGLDCRAQAWAPYYAIYMLFSMYILYMPYMLYMRYMLCLHDADNMLYMLCSYVCHPCGEIWDILSQILWHILTPWDVWRCFIV